MRIGMLTGGGDCPGLERGHPRRRAQGRRPVRPQHRRLPPRLARRDRRRVDGPVGVGSVRGLLPRGGTILGTSRTNPYKTDDGAAQGDGDARARPRRRADRDRRRGHARRRAQARARRRAASSACRRRSTTTSRRTDFTFGFHTAVQIATDAIDRLHTTAESHDRVMVVEVMGRHAGWIATYSGLAGGADIILIPEEPFDIDEVCDRITHRHQRGASFSIVVVAEGATPDEGTMELAVGRGRRVRPRAARRHRQPPAPRRSSSAPASRRGMTQPRPRAARRQPDRVRPRDRDPVRHRGDRRGQRGRLRRDGRAARHRRRSASRSKTASTKLKTVDQKLFDTAAVFFG